MGWWEWVREFTGGIGERIETGLREFLGMPAEIEPYLPERPATLEQISEAMEEAAYAARFIQEIEISEAFRLARAVRFYEPLTNMARLRHWTTANPWTTAAPRDAMWSIRAVLVAPDGALIQTDIRGKTGQKMDYDEFVRAVAASLPKEFVDRYEKVSRTLMAREWIVAQETYVERFKPLRRS